MLLHDLLSLEGEHVLRSFDKLLSHQSRMNAATLVHIAVIDSRNLFLARGFESMKSYLMDRMELTEDAAYKRIQVARLAKELPLLFRAIADGRLTIKAVRMIATRLTASNVDELVGAMAHKSATEVELELARRFPRSEVLQLEYSEAVDSVAPGQPSLPEPLPPMSDTAPKVRTKIEALSSSRFTLQASLPGSARDKLRRLQDLLAHSIPNGDVAEIIERSFDVHIEKLERQKFGIGAMRSRRSSKPTVRSIPARTKKAVYDRDGGQCAHMYQDGQRCPNRAALEFDHIVPVAKGGKTTIDNLRLLCRAHNQHAADQAFGQEFMDTKRANRRRFASK